MGVSESVPTFLLMNIRGSQLQVWIYEYQGDELPVKVEKITYTKGDSPLQFQDPTIGVGLIGSDRYGLSMRVEPLSTILYHLHNESLLSVFYRYVKCGVRY